MKVSIISHRVNAIESLRALDPSFGAEIDLRSCVQEPGRIHLSHDPWALGDDWGSWLQVFAERKIHGTLIVNTKEDGLEESVMADLARLGVTNFFFLDTAVPTLVRLARA